MRFLSFANLATAGQRDICGTILSKTTNLRSNVLIMTICAGKGFFERCSCSWYCRASDFISKTLLPICLPSSGPDMQAGQLPMTLQYDAVHKIKEFLNWNSTIKGLLPLPHIGAVLAAGYRLGEGAEVLIKTVAT